MDFKDEVLINNQINNEVMTTTVTNGVYSSNKRTARRQRALERLLSSRERAIKQLENLKQKDKEKKQVGDKVVVADYSSYEANIARMDKEISNLQSKLKLS